MKHTLNTGEGEALTLAPPINGDVIVKIDSQRMDVPFSMGTHTLPRGGAVQPHRHLARDVVLFVHKGQGRVTVAGRPATVVPGMAVWVPRQTWCEVQNTGTGTLQFLWVSTPPGVEQYLRELSRLGRSADAAAVLSVAQRHGVEVLPQQVAAKEQAPGGGGRRPRHGRRRHAQDQTKAGQRPPPTTGSSPPAVSPLPPPAEGPPSTPSPAPRPRTAGRRAHRRRVKEVYMGGRWVQVTGEGPVIDSGHGQPET
ncbi:MAG: cupin domain-containing protein [Candidatus Omnitrophota bacterium]|nr:cupin domain-containing protein [Candidatus Omnitrophota bacterium]